MNLGVATALFGGVPLKGLLCLATIITLSPILLPKCITIDVLCRPVKLLY